MIYHYTTIETFALMIKNKTLRFNRLSQVDDLTEAETNDYGNKGDYVYVSCWTDKERENVALWNMYAKQMSGIRIGIKSNNIPFKFLYEGTGLIKNIINLKENECVFLPHYEESNTKFHTMNYTKEKTPNLIERNDKGWPIIHLEKIATYKSKEWECQQEVRFVLIGATTENKSSYGIVKALTSRNESSPISSPYLDLQLDEDTFSEMEITLSPKSNEAQEVICKALVDTYLPNIKSTIKINKSSLRLKC